jgi:hypothetical protein
VSFCAFCGLKFFGLGFHGCVLLYLHRQRSPLGHELGAEWLRAQKNSQTSVSFCGFCGKKYMATDFTEFH